VILELKLANQLERLDRRIFDLTDRVATLEVRPAPAPDNDVNGSDDDDLDVYDANGNLDITVTMQNRLRCRLQINTQGIGGARHNQRHQGNRNRAPDDPYAKVKLTIPSFDGHYDAEAYLDWGMTIEQKFSAHQVPEEHRVRQATSEFKDFAIIWWTALASDGNTPRSWVELNVAMHDRYVPSSYHRDLRKINVFRAGR